MPTVEVDYDELRELAGVEKEDDELEWDLFNLGLEYEGETEDGDARLELESDRLDRLSVEGIARSLRYQYGESRGVFVPETNAVEWTVEVEDVPEQRPYVTAAVVRGVDLDEDGLDSLIQLQEKLHATMGRKRAKGAIGIHDLAMLKGMPTAEGEGTARGTVRYTGIEPDGDRFVPLDSDREMTPEQVLDDHTTGREYADLVAEYDSYPAIYDDIGLFSFPPVINGRRTEVTTDSRELFVEMTGTDQWTIDRMLNIVCYALSARGATIEDVEVSYPGETVVRPDLETTEKTLTHGRVETMLGVDFDPKEVLDLLERSGLSGELVDADATATDGADSARRHATDRPSGDLNSNPNSNPEATAAYEVEIPPYRVDVLHPLDVVDDIGRAYGFNELEPRYPEVSTVGGRHDRSTLEDAVRTTLVGLGFEDLLDFHLIAETEVHGRMRLGPDTEALGGGKPVEITNPYSEEYGVVRTWALPSLMMVLENNTHRAYPQDLAEVGLVATVDETGEAETGVDERRHVAGVLARTDASYEDAKARLQAIARNFGVDLETPPTDHPSFIPGRTAVVRFDGQTAGVVGELHPEVLVEHDLELPVVGFEFELDALR
jgi:phenylalanyl-tRNA synthetase beta chain